MFYLLLLRSHTLSESSGASQNTMARILYVIGLLLLLSPVIRAARRNRAHVTSLGNQTSKSTKSILGSIFGEPQLVTIFALKIVTFDFGDNAAIEQELRDSGRYDPKSAITYDGTVDTAARSRVFVTTPLVARGIPVTLSTLPLDGSEHKSLKPYPNLNVHRTTEDVITDCSTQLVSVFTTAKVSSDGDTLYVLDNGVLDIIKSPKMVCPPKIVSFDLRTDKVKKVTIIENAACNAVYSLIRVEECSAGQLTAYVADSAGFTLTVTDLTTGDSKHLQSQYFYPKPGFFFTKAGAPPTYVPYGLYGIAGGDSCDDKLYVQGHATDVQGVLSKDLIRSASDGDVLDTMTQVALPGLLSGPSGPLAADASGQLLFFPQQDQFSVYCWNTRKPHNSLNFRVIAHDNEKLQYFGFMKVDSITRRLYLGTNRFTKYLSNTIDYSDYNFRLMYIDLNGIRC